MALENEHKIPLSRGGANNAANIVPACKQCNLRKWILTDEEYRSSRRDDSERERLLKSKSGEATVNFPHMPPVPAKRAERSVSGLLARLAPRRREHKAELGTETGGIEEPPEA